MFSMKSPDLFKAAEAEARSPEPQFLLALMYTHGFNGVKACDMAPLILFRYLIVVIRKLRSILLRRLRTADT